MKLAIVLAGSAVLGTRRGADGEGIGGAEILLLRIGTIGPGRAAAIAQNGAAVAG